MIPDAIISPEQSMGAEIVPLLSPASPAVPSLEQVREYIRASKAENTATRLPERLAPLLCMV